MDFQQLRYVVTLARELHFHKAAQAANVTQPTLSQQIKKLEEEFGTTLFERSPRGVRLTAAGNQFIPKAQTILDQAQNAVSALHAVSGDISGTIRIGVIPTICPYFMPSVFKDLHKKAPNIRLELFEETTSILLEHLKSGKLDMGVLALPVEDRGIASLSIGHEEFYLAVSKDHRLCKRKTVSVKDLADERLLILQEGHCFRSQSLEFCKKTDEDPQVVFQGSSLTSVMKLTESGEGITLVPKMAAQSSSASLLKFIPFTLPKPNREIGIVWRVSAPLTGVHDKLIDVIRLQKLWK